MSAPLQNRLSLHGSEFALCRQVPVELQTSVVHTLLSLAHAVPGSALSAPQTPVPSHVSTVHELPSSAHGVPSGSKQLLPDSSQMFAQSEPPVHGSPACTEQLPPEQVSAPLQNKPSSQLAVLFGCVHDPEPLHTSFVQTFPSLVHDAPLGELQVSPLSLQTF